MSDIKLGNLSPVVANKIKPFIEEILRVYSENIHSIHIVGSSITGDFHEKTSDINSIFVLKEMNLKFVELIAPFGKRYRKKGIAAPLIMTPGYIKRSLDVFPIEFLDFKLIHETVFGEDILKDIEIDISDLRRQCEREIKTKLIVLRQGYISSQGDKKIIAENIVSRIAGYIPLFRSIIYLMGKKPPVRKYEVLTDLSAHTGVNIDILKKILDMKRGTLKLAKNEIDSIFEEYYRTTEEISNLIDEHQI
jgi:predicted nucleotidyltransferase